MRIVIVSTLVIVAVAMVLFRPVCVPLGAEDVRWFNSPIEQDTQRDFYMKIFQKRGGQWYQCKTWMSRELFF